MTHLTDQVAVVTGASKGIGKAIAIRLAQEGIHVALLGRSLSLLEEAADACTALGVQAMPVQCDLSQISSLEKVVQQILDKFNTIHILINNAGQYVNGSADQCDLAKWDRALDINLRAMMHLTRHTLPHIKKNTSGAIINIASISGKLIHKGGANYCATKHGVLGYTGCLFEDVRDLNIKVSAICPGYVNTLMAPDHSREKMIQPEDIAHAVHFILTCPATACPTEIVIRPQRPIT